MRTVTKVFVTYVSWFQGYWIVGGSAEFNSQYDQLLGSLIAQLVEHCTGIAEVMGSNPVQASAFF